MIICSSEGTAAGCIMSTVQRWKTFHPALWTDQNLVAEQVEIACVAGGIEGAWNKVLAVERLISSSEAARNTKSSSPFSSRFRSLPAAPPPKLNSARLQYRHFIAAKTLLRAPTILAATQAKVETFHCALWTYQHTAGRITYLHWFIIFSSFFSCSNEDFIVAKQSLDICMFQFIMVIELNGVQFGLKS